MDPHVCLDFLQPFYSILYIDR